MIDTEILGTCGMCPEGVLLPYDALVNFTGKVEFAKCDACGCVHSNETVNVLRFDGYEQVILEQQIWKPIL